MRVSKWKTVLVLCLLCALVVVAGCGTSQEQSQTEKKETTEELQPLEEPVTVKIAEDGSPSGAGFYIATEKGYFEDFNIEVEYVTFASSKSMLPALASDQVQIAGGIMSVSLFNAVKRGLDIRIIGEKGYNYPGEPYFDLVVGKQFVDEIESLSDLEGKKIAITSEGSIDEMFVDWALKSAGLTKDDVEYVLIEDFGKMNAALANGGVHAAMHIEPLITMGEEKGILERWVDPQNWAADCQIAEVLASPAFVKNRELAKRFMVAYVKGIRDYNDAFLHGKNTEEIIDIMIEYTPMKERDLWKKVYVTGLKPSGKVNAESIKEQLQWFKDMGYFEGQVDLDEIIDNSLAEFAVDYLGEYEPPGE